MHLMMTKDYQKEYSAFIKTFEKKDQKRIFSKNQCIVWVFQ